MIKVLLFSIALSSILFASEPTHYINMSYGELTNSDNGTVKDFKPTGFKWTLGTVLEKSDNISLAIEASVMLGVKDDRKASVNSVFSGSFGNATTSLDELYNINFRG